MTVVVCLIVLRHNLSEYKCQMCIFYPVSQKYLADLFSCIHYIFISDCTQLIFLKEIMSTHAQDHSNTIAVFRLKGLVSVVRKQSLVRVNLVKVEQVVLLLK